MIIARPIDDKGVKHAFQFAKDLKQFGFSSGTVEAVGLFSYPGNKTIQEIRTDISMAFEKILAFHRWNAWLKK